ncbi:MAG: Gfo/Idh/MocA family oxidoreductase [Verrucomicrobiota bacterium]
MIDSMLNRRNFIKTSTKVGACSLFFPSIIKAENLNQDKVRVAVIGVGGRGNVHVTQLKKHAELVAFCDVNEASDTKPSGFKNYKTAVETYSKFPEVPRFKDYRVMFDKMGKEIDAVSVAVPDHMHYPIGLWVMAQGKHLLLEKPLVRTFEEAMHIKQVAKETGVITQMGNQGHAREGVRLFQEWIDAGLIGDVQEVYHWTNRPIWPQGMDQFNQPGVVPDGFDWNLWQGVAKPMDYRGGIAPFDWRAFIDYGCGAIGDIACHCMDASYTPLGLKFPTRVEAVKGKVTPVAFPEKSKIDFEFVTKFGKPVTLHWMDGKLLPEDVPHVPQEFFGGKGKGKGDKSMKPLTTGTLIVGSKGTMKCDIYGGRIGIFPVDYFNQLKSDKAFPPKTLPRVKGDHFSEWLRAIKDNKQPGSNIVDYAADFTAAALLGVIAMVVEGPLTFDPDKKVFVNNPEANKLLKSQYEYRKEFLPG